MTNETQNSSITETQSEFSPQSLCNESFPTIETLVTHFENIVRQEPSETYPKCPKRIFIHGTSSTNFKGLISSGTFIAKPNNPYFTTDILQSVIHAAQHSRESADNEFVVTLWNSRSGNIHPSVIRHSYEVQGNLSTENMYGAVSLNVAASNTINKALERVLDPDLDISKSGIEELVSTLKEFEDAGQLELSGIDIEDLSHSLIRGVYEYLLTTQVRSPFVSLRNLCKNGKTIPKVFISNIEESLENISVLDVSTVSDLQEYKEWGQSVLNELHELITDNYKGNDDIPIQNQ